MMVGLVLYAYAVGTRSSRAIERGCREDVAFRVLAANRAPDHATIARFLGRHRAALAELFTQVLAMCARAGLASVGTVAVDGSKLAANAALRANRAYPAIRAEVERMLAEGAAIDAAEDELYGDARGDELPPELADPRSRRARLEQIKRELEAEEAAREAAWADKQRERAEHRERTGSNPTGRPPKAPAVDALARQERNSTDPDSRPMRLRGMPIQAYNAQIVANEQQLILAPEVTNDANDKRQLIPMLAAVAAELRAAGIEADIATVLADTGYWDHDAIRDAAARGIEVLIPTAVAHRRAPRRRAALQGPEADRINRVLATADGRARYRRRQVMVEPVFARTKHHRRIDRFWRRGLAATKAEWRLIATTHNLLRLHSVTAA
jgi:Transposase DDE domain/Transposase domain (DUF772)